MIKLVVSDMDGTLLNHHAEITKKNLEAIQLLAEKGIEFAIASGRDYEGVYSIVHSHDIQCEAILGNGAQYVDKDANILMSHYLNKNVYKDIVNIFIHADIPYMVFTTQGFYTSQDPVQVRELFIERCYRKFGKDPEEYKEGGQYANVPCNHLQRIEDVEDFLNQDFDIIKVEAFSLNPSDLIPAKEELSKIPTISYLSSFDDNVEVTDENAQKGLILQQVAKLKGLKEDEIMILGDGMNDITLFEHFPYSFAPENAEETIKDMAHHIVSDCEKSGFAEAIEFMLRDFQD